MPSHPLIQTQAWDVFLVGHMAIIKFCQAFLFSHYVNLDIAFKFNVFYFYKCLVDSSHDLIIM
jgi:hypothetical protein